MMAGEGGGRSKRGGGRGRCDRSHKSLLASFSTRHYDGSHSNNTLHWSLGTERAIATTLAAQDCKTADQSGWRGYPVMSLVHLLPSVRTNSSAGSGRERAFSSAQPSRAPLTDSRVTLSTFRVISARVDTRRVCILLRNLDSKVPVDDCLPSGRRKAAFSVLAAPSLAETLLARMWVFLWCSLVDGTAAPHAQLALTDNTAATTTTRNSSRASEASRWRLDGGGDEVRTREPAPAPAPAARKWDENVKEGQGEEGRGRGRGRGKLQNQPHQKRPQPKQVTNQL